jgi:hypothetical protein
MSQISTPRAIVPEDVSAGARVYGYFTARLVHKSGAARRNLQVSSLAAVAVWVQRDQYSS